MSMTKHTCQHSRQRGTSLLEVLITIIILAFGLLGLAGLQSKIQIAEMESYQRAQAILLLSDMVSRINSSLYVDYTNSTAATQAAAETAIYEAASPMGTDDAQPANCAALAVGAARDVCEWSNALKGAGEQTGSVNTGAMLGGRGCIEQLQAPNATGVCLPGIYQVTVVWQGINPTAAPSSSMDCGQGSYDPDTTRRAISSQITVGLPTCLD